jgi:hypothetical protein
MLPGWIPTLLADEGQFGQILNSMRSGFRGRSTPLSTHTVVMAVLWACMAVMVLWLANRARQRVVRMLRNTPRWLFRQLCAAHRLKWKDRRLLWQVAQEQYPKNPPQLFVDPDSLTAPRLGVRKRAEMDRLAALREQLFSEPEESPKSNGTALSEPQAAASAPPAAAPVAPSINISSLFDGTPFSTV